MRKDSIMQNTNNPAIEKSRPRYGEIWTCNLSENEGSIQGGYRPVFIVSNDKNNTYSSTINIIPITSKMNKRKLPVHVELWNYQKYGLRSPSTIMIEQTTTVTLESLDKYIGKILDRNVLGDISRAMTVQFPIIAV